MTVTEMSEGTIHNRMGEIRLAHRTAGDDEKRLLATEFGNLADELADRMAVYVERGTDPYGQTC